MRLKLNWFAGTLDMLRRRSSSEVGARLWDVFLIARVALAMVLMLIQVLLYSLPENGRQVLRADDVMTVLLLTYLLETMVTWQLNRWRQWGQRHPVWIWVLSVLVDLGVFTWLYMVSADSYAYLLLFMFSILMVSSLAPRWMVYLVCLYALGVMLMRSGVSSFQLFENPVAAAGHLPSLIAGLGLFALGELTYQLAARLRREEHRATEGMANAKQQQLLNELIVAEMSMGVVVADHLAALKMINPAAVALITGKEMLTQIQMLPPEELGLESGWQQLQEVVKTLFESDVGNRWLVFDFSLQQGVRGSRMLQIKGRLLNTGGVDNKERMCLLFLTDMRDVDKRMQQEKLAAMGRMSASIAHEIRNPLATITSANTLLSEGLSDQGSLRLSEMIATNAQRLARIVKDVLDVAHMQDGGDVEAVDLLFLLPEIVGDWMRTHELQDVIKTQWPDDLFGVFIAFDAEHLRRVLINLLDNATRYASRMPGAIIVSCRVYQLGDNEMVRISVYSDGQELDEATEKSLFEPFFSTEVRGTGLGLYICRSLCNRYGASLDYQRVSKTDGEKVRSYNEFYITATRVDPLPGETRILLEQTRI